MDNEMANKIGRMESTLEAILQRLDQMADARNRDKDTDKAMAERLRQLDISMAKLTERNDYLEERIKLGVKLLTGAGAGSAVGVGHLLLRVGNVPVPGIN